MIKSHVMIGQKVNFDGLQYGNIHPTDIDGLIEYKDIARVFLEFKYRGAQMPRGQRVALERIVDDARKAGREAVLFLCSHNNQAGREDIDAASAIVTAIYWNGKWRPATGKTVRQQCDRFFLWVESLA